MPSSGTIHRLAAAAVLASAVAVSARAQVLEIAPGGTVTRYDGPAVFTADGASPFAPAPGPVRRGQPRPDALRRALRDAAEAAAISPELVGAVAWRESGLRADRVSAKGALGPMQLMPATARGLGVDPADARANLHGGAIYLAQMMKRYDGDLLRALAAYNAGPGAVDRHGGAPPYRETQAYVGAVLERLSQAVVPEAPVRASR